MSAIWGMVSFVGCVPETVGEMMEDTYRTACRLDRIESVRDTGTYMGCGIQYITKEARNETLPVYDREKGICFTADCILDNRRQLMEELQTEDEALPDGTLMYRAYLKWGMGCLSHFRGLFCLAVYDIERGVLCLAADPLASRCLYYHRQEGGASFSTLIAPIRKVHPEIGINTFYIKDFLVAPGLMPNVSSVDTPYEDVYKLNPGTYMELSSAGAKEIVYWTPEAGQPGSCCRSAAEYGEYFRKLFGECVKDALRTEGEVGIALSSGLDSASVGAFAAGFLKEEHKSLYTYTYVPFEATDKVKSYGRVMDESMDVMKLVEMYPNMVPRFLNNGGRNCYEDMPEILELLEIPYKAFVNLPSLCELYSQASQAGCRIALNGQFGNSTISYGNIEDVLYDLYLEKHYLTCLDYLNHYCIAARVSRKRTLKGFLRVFSKADKEDTEGRFSYQPDNPFLSGDILTDYPMEERFTEAGMRRTESTFCSHRCYMENLYRKSIYTYIGEVETKLGLAYGLVIRDPTRDMRMMSFCYHLPYRLFAYKGTPRWLVRSNLRAILPADYIDDWGRRGMQNPDWIARIARDWETVRPRMEECLSRECLPGYVDREKSRQFLEGWSKGQTQEDARKIKHLAFICILSWFLKR